MRAHEIRASDGYVDGVGNVRLYYRSWEAPSARAALIVVHGLGEHSGRYAAFAEALAGYGISTFVLDHRGHGLSEGRRGHTPRFGTFLQDLDRFRREVHGLIDFGLPLFLFGHSLGGLIALRYLEEYDSTFHGGIISSPWLATAIDVPRWKINASGLLNRILPALPFATGLDPADLSRDPEIVRAYRDDPLVHDRITPRLFSESAAAMGSALQRSDHLSVPLLFLLAGRDRIVHTEKSRLFAQSLSTRVSVTVYPDNYHENLNEPNRTNVVRDVRDWILKVGSGHPLRGERNGVEEQV